MKWLGRILYIVMIFFIGVFVFALNNNKQLINYYEDYALEELENYNREEYMEHFMTSRLVKEYLKDPVYVALSDDTEYPFELAIYHARVNVSKDDVRNYLILYLNEKGINFEEKLVKYDNYKENNNLALMLAKIKLEGLEEDFNIPININMKERNAIHLVELSKNDNKEDIFNVQYRDESSGKTLTEKSTVIERITLSILDGTNGTKEDEIVETIFATFESDKNANMDGIIDSFIKKDFIQTKEDEEGNEEVITHKDVLTANSFNGEAKSYEMVSKYDDENNLGVVHDDLLAPYMKKAKNSLYWYGLIIALVTYLIFFLKPTIEYFKNRKSSSNNDTNNNSEDFTNFKIDKKEEVEVIAEPLVKEEIDYSKFTVKELKDIAKDKELKGYSTLKKDELIELIKESENN